jgi:hypothetical protein
MAIAQRYMEHQNMGRGGGGPSGLADVLEVLLDRGLVIDAFVRVSLVGIELLTIDARIVVASVDTYLRFAEAVNRLDLLQQSSSQTLGEFTSQGMEKGAEQKAKGAFKGIRESLGGGSRSEEKSDKRDKEKSEAKR